jgi:hypothetical protein
MMGLYYSQIFNTTAGFDEQHSEHTKTASQRTVLLQQLYYATCFTGDSSNRTVSGRLQHTTQDRTLQYPISLLTNTGPQDHTLQQSLFLASPDCTALEVQY